MPPVSVSFHQSCPSFDGISGMRSIDNTSPVSGAGGVIYDLHYVVHVLLNDSFLDQRGYFFPLEPLNQLEISALTECELKRFSWAFRAGVPSPPACLPLARLFFVPQ